MCRKEVISLSLRPEDSPYEIPVYIPSGKPKAMVQLVHGMAEHIARYHAFAMTLCQAGYIVAGHNHKGHGPSCKKEELGYFYDSDGWNKNIENIHAVTTYLKERFQGVKLVLFGHSMGSFMAREFAIRYGTELGGLLISSTGHQPLFMATVGKMLASCCPQKKSSPLVDAIAFSAYNKHIENPTHPFDWLSRDKAQVQAYVDDPYCGFMFTGGAFKDFFGGLAKLSDVKRLQSMPKTLPVYFIAGDCDPVGNMGKGVLQVVAQFKKANMQSVKCDLYKGARHELLNEINREEVITAIVAWLDDVIKEET